MTSIRLPSDIENKLTAIAEAEKTTKSEIIKKALTAYLERYFVTSSPYELGKDLFGKFGSGQSNLSTDYKKSLREKLYAKYSH
ncbi:hypothetical protein ES703_93208 [subsurface metagenome]